MTMSNVPGKIIDVLEMDGVKLSKELALTDIYRSGVNKNLKVLGVSNSSEYSQFCKVWNPNWLSPIGGQSTLPLIDPSSDELIDEWRWMRSELELSSNYIPLETPEAGSALVLSASSGDLYELDFRDINALNSGTLEPRWQGFYQFFFWYILESK